MNAITRHASDLKIERREGRDAMRELATRLGDAGLSSAGIPGMEPEFLAEGLEGDRPGTVVAYQDGRPAAYLAYALHRKQLRPALGAFSLPPLPFRQLRLFGYAARADAPAAALEDCFDVLLRDRAWHIAQAFELPEGDPLARHLQRTAAARGYSLVEKSVATIQVKIEDTFDAYLQNNFTKKTRYNLKREIRLLENAAPGEVAIKSYTSPAEAADFLRDAERVARRSYQWELGWPTVRPTAGLVRRTNYLAASGKWRGYLLFIRGVPAAFCYATIRRGELSYDMVAYDSDFARLNPGKVLLFKIIEELHATRAFERLEFGRGLYDYKRVFANAERRVVDASLYAAGPYPQFLRLLAGAADAGYQWLRPLVRPWIPRIRGRFQGVIGLLVPEMIESAEIALAAGCC